jgi:hypothetical protein
MPHVTVLKPVGPRELDFVRPSVRALEGARRGCAQCGRTPLVGETVYFYGERMVCELCRHLRREAPGRTEVVHSPEHQRAVKRQPRAA